MRLVLLAFSIICLAAAAPGSGFISTVHAQARECVGENCPPAGGQGSGRDCESRQEDTIS